MDASFIAPDKPIGLRSRAEVSIGTSATATLLIAIYAIVVSLMVMPTNVDVSWLLTIGERVLNGERLYIDIVEVNPPFSVWLYLPFLVMERLTGLSAEIWVSVGVVALVVASVCFSARILARADETLKRYVWLIPIAAFFVLFLFPPDFGQREQIAVIALLPWLALLSARDRTADFRAGNLAEWIVAGVGAGIFLMIKPPFSVLALAVPALTIALQRRSLHPLLTPENIVGGTLTVAYLIALAVFMQPFFTDVLPLLRQVYLPMRLPVFEVLKLWPVTMFAAIAAATLAMGHPCRRDRDAKILLLAGAAYVPAFVIMGKGWTYQALPFLTFGVLALLLQYIRLKSLQSLPLLAKVGLALGLFSIVKLAVAQQGLAFAQPRSDLDVATAAVTRAIDHPTFMSIGSRLQAGNPLARMTGARVVARNPSAWMINDAGILIQLAHDPAQRLDLETLRQEYMMAIASELAAKQPDIVVDDGTAEPHAPTPLRDNVIFAKALGGYRPLVQNGSVTVLIRADIIACK
ncbi:hypothetical protein FJ951_24145 [Mesorhizobium sp. B2-2-3]|uniref:hypothetical protein n=1 Tax=Mesorhizobium sp. B2-2-3 TaxID=2589963 RepID=UPI00112B1429|nr:hypothetical protein [Mesorhizobium sp. B2-2-3]TPM42501.1 hypothetical protein FJ951_24145 [Mesorhizobium sp. B2-2-3]